jgi:hypothetical protein
VTVPAPRAHIPADAVNSGRGDLRLRRLRRPGVVAYAVSIGGSRLTATNLNVGRFLVSKFVRLALTALLTLSTLAALAMSASADFVGPGS